MTILFTLIPGFWENLFKINWINWGRGLNGFDSSMSFKGIMKGPKILGFCSSYWTSLSVISSVFSGCFSSYSDWSFCWNSFCSSIFSLVSSLEPSRMFLAFSSSSDPNFLVKCWTINWPSFPGNSLVILTIP